MNYKTTETHLYTNFGKAVASCQQLEFSIKHMLALAHSHNKQRPEEEYTEYLEGISRKTMGMTFKVMKKLMPVFYGDNEEIFRSALESRNHVAHTFFIENIDNIIKPENIGLAVDNLSRYIEIFDQANKVMEQHNAKILRAYSVTEDILRQVASDLYGPSIASKLAVSIDEKMRITSKSGRRLRRT